MLLPSVALNCDASTPNPRSLFASPPLSPPSSSHSTINNLYSTCRALQSMLTMPTTPTQLPSPPLTHAESPFKLRLRARKDDSSPGVQRKKITKRPAPPPRGMSKRRRAVEDDMSRYTADNAEADDEPSEDETMAPSTPKRMRLAPESLPLGLERSDFHNLHLQQVEAQGEVEGEGKGDEWSMEDDSMLVELVLEKLKLSKSEWQDCARSLGRDRGSVNKRWKSLMAGGEVGLKGRKRGRIHATWR